MSGGATLPPTVNLCWLTPTALPLPPYPYRPSPTALDHFGRHSGTRRRDYADVQKNHDAPAVLKKLVDGV
jgi:hypothetical protein